MEIKEAQLYLMSDEAKIKCDLRIGEIVAAFDAGFDRLGRAKVTNQEEYNIEIEALMRAACGISAGIIDWIANSGIDSIVLYNLHCTNLMASLNIKEEEEAKKYVAEENKS